MSTITEDDARTAAKALLIDNGYAFLVRWPDGHWTAEARKPLTRTREMRVIEKRADGTEVLA